MKLWPGDKKIDWVLVGAFERPETARMVGDAMEEHAGIRTKVEDTDVFTARSRAPEAVMFIEDYMMAMHQLEKKHEVNDFVKPFSEDQRMVSEMKEEVEEKEVEASAGAKASTEGANVKGEADIGNK